MSIHNCEFAFSFLLFKIPGMTSWHFLMADRSCPQPWLSPPIYPPIPSFSVTFPLYRDWETVCLGSFFPLIFKLVHWEICTMYFDHINSLLHSFQIQSSSWPIQLGSLSIILTYQHSCCCSNAPRCAVSHWSMIIPPEDAPGSYHSSLARGGTLWPPFLPIVGFCLAWTCTSLGHAVSLLWVHTCNCPAVSKKLFSCSHPLPLALVCMCVCVCVVGDGWGSTRDMKAEGGYGGGRVQGEPGLWWVRRG